MSIGHFSTGDLEVAVKDDSSLEQAKPLIDDAFQHKVGKSGIQQCSHLVHRDLTDRLEDQVWAVNRAYRSKTHPRSRRLKGTT